MVWIWAWCRGEFTNSIRYNDIHCPGCDCEAGINTDINRLQDARNTEWNSTPVLALRDLRQLSPSLGQFIKDMRQYAEHISGVGSKHQVYAWFSNHKRSLIIELIKYEKEREDWWKLRWELDKWEAGAGGSRANGQQNSRDTDSCDQGRLSLSHRRYLDHHQGGYSQ